MPNDQTAGTVGFKRPPKNGQFRPGQSGNPHGRPAGVRNFKADLLDELREPTTIHDNGRDQQVSKQRAFIKTLVAAAIAGDMRATATLVSFCTRSLGGQPDVEVDAAGDDLDIIESYVARERKQRRSLEAEIRLPRQQQEEKAS